MMKEEVHFYPLITQANSEHPLEKAVVEHAKWLWQKHGSSREQVTEVRDFEVHPGTGVSGKVGDRRVLVGNKRLMNAFNVSVGYEVESYIFEN